MTIDQLMRRMAVQLRGIIEKLEHPSDNDARGAAVMAQSTLDDLHEAAAKLRALDQRIAGLEERIKQLEAVLVSRHGGEPLALLEELDAWRQYALDVEEFTEMNLGVYLDRAKWEKLKESKPKEES